jgi:hypothetical protein
MTDAVPPSKVELVLELEELRTHLELAASRCVAQIESDWLTPGGAMTAGTLSTGTDELRTHVADYVRVLKALDHTPEAALLATKELIAGVTRRNDDYAVLTETVVRWAIESYFATAD